MRAISAKQRFPVAQWKRDLETLQSTSIKLHDKIVAKRSEVRHKRGRGGRMSGVTAPHDTPQERLDTTATNTPEDFFLQRHSWNTRPASAILVPQSDLEAPIPMGRITGPGHEPDANDVRAQWPMLEAPFAHDWNGQASASDSEIEDNVIDGYLVNSNEAEVRGRNVRSRFHPETDEAPFTPASPKATPLSPETRSPIFSPSTSGTVTPKGESEEEVFVARRMSLLAHPPATIRRIETQLSLANVLNVVKDSQLQKVEPFFTDPTGLYYRTFERMLEGLNGKTSEGPLCVEEYLVASEREWFGRFHDAKMGVASHVGTPRTGTPAESLLNEPLNDDHYDTDNAMAQFFLPEGYESPTGLRKLLLIKIGDWPIYTFLLAFVWNIWPLSERGADAKLDRVKSSLPTHIKSHS